MIKLALSVSKAEPKSKTEGMKVTEFKRSDFEFDKLEEYIKKLFTTRLYSTNYWLDGRCSQKNFLGLYGVTLDVDAGLSLVDARELFKEYNYIIHTSTSHRADKGKGGVQDRFRVILPFEPAHYNDYDLEKAQAVYGILINKYSFIDAQCAEPARKYFPFLNTLYPHLFECYINDTGKYYEITSEEISAHLIRQEEFRPQKSTSVNEIVDENKKYIHWDDEIETVRGTFTKIRNVAPDEHVKSVYCPYCDDKKASPTPSAHLLWTKGKKPELYCDGCKHDGKQFRFFLPLNEQFEECLYIDDKVYDIRVSDTKITIAKTPLSYFSALTPDESKKLFLWLAQNRRVSAEELQIQRKVDGYAERHTWKLDTTTGILEIIMAPIPVKIKDNKYINDWIVELVGPVAAEYIKDMIMASAFLNFRKLPVLIMMGERNSGKTTLAEAIGSIFPDSYTKWDGKPNQFNPYLEKRIVLIDEALLNKSEAYNMFKEICGEKEHTVNKKHKAQYQVMNNTMFFLASNNYNPLYFRYQEMPKSERDNQWMVIEFANRSDQAIDAFKFTEIMDRWGWYIRSEMRERYERFLADGNGRKNRYTIPNPVTELLIQMFENAKTNLDYLADDIYKALRNGYPILDPAGNVIRRLPPVEKVTIAELHDFIKATGGGDIKNVKSTRERLQTLGYLGRKRLKKDESDAWEVLKVKTNI
jgi:hypothetical protein